MARSRTAAKPAPATPDTTPTPVTALDPDTARYNWDELDAAVADATDTDRTAFDVVTHGEALVAEGAEIASDRILTDSQRWIGQLVDYERALAKGATRVRGYKTGLLRVYAARVKTLRSLLATFNEDNADAKQSQTASDSTLKAAALEAQSRYRDIRSALHGALRDDSALAAKLDELWHKPARKKLPEAMVKLAKLIESVSAAGPKVAARVAARDVTADDAVALRSLAKTLAKQVDNNTGGTRGGTVTKSRLDAEDGAILALMEELLVLFPSGLRRVDVPVLRPIATRSYFHSSSKRRAPKADEPTE